MNQNANDQLLLLRENTERRVSTLCRAPLRVAFCEAFFIHSRMLDSCWVLVVQSCTPRTSLVRMVVFRSFMNPGSACLWVRVPCIVTFQGKMFGISSAKSAGQLGVSPGDLEFVGMAHPGLVVHHMWMTL